MRTILALVLSAVACRAAIDPFFYIPSNLCAGPAGDLVAETFGEFLVVIKKCTTATPGTVSFDAYSFGVASSGALTAIDHITVEWYKPDGTNITVDLAKASDKAGLLLTSWQEAKLLLVALNGSLTVGRNQLNVPFLPFTAYDVSDDKTIFYYLAPLTSFPYGSCYFQLAGEFYISCVGLPGIASPASLWNTESIAYNQKPYFFQNDEFSNNLITTGWDGAAIRSRPSLMGNHTAGTWWLNKAQDLAFLMFGFDSASKAQVYNVLTGEFGTVINLLPNIQSLAVKDTCAYLTAGTATAVNQVKLPTGMWGPSSFIDTRTLSAAVIGVYPSMTDSIIYVLNATHVGYAEVTCP